MPGPLAAGERVLLIDPKDRRYLLTLVTGATFHTHAGVLAHDDIIGAAEGCRVAGSTGRSFLVLRPTLSDIVLKMPRGAQVIYPKDLGAILIAADIAPGQRVLEAGVGSGALSMTVLRAGASDRRLRAPGGLRRAGPGQRGGHARPRRALPRRDPRRDRGHRRDGTSTGSCSTCPSPTRWSPARRRPSAPAASCWPTCRPSTRRRCCARRSTRTDAPFGLAETQEIMRRTWHVEARSVRPDHRMVGHTGFLTTARRLDG